MRLDDLQLVEKEYANEAGLVSRRSIYEKAVYEDSNGPLEVMFAAIEEVSPRRVLEVGCGPGEAAERIALQLSAEVIALDTSPRMVELAQARRIDARIGDVQDLPFADGSFDCALAAWMLFHVPDVDRALSELACACIRRPPGRGYKQRAPSLRGASARRYRHARTSLLQPGERAAPT